jgi:RNA polymerase sigma-70 factor (ECF subfamily)
MRTATFETRLGMTGKRQPGATDIMPREVGLHQADRDEQDLIRRLQAGDHRAFDAIYRRYFARVYRQVAALCRSDAEAEEVVQDVFLAIYTKARSYRGEAAFATWLYRVTMNVALSRLRRLKRNKEVSLDEYLPSYQEDGHHQVRPVVDWSPLLEDRLAKEELRGFLKGALATLSPLDRAIVVQSDLEGLSNREIGAALGLTVAAVKSRLHRSRLYLRGKLAVRLGYSPS